MKLDFSSIVITEVSSDKVTGTIKEMPVTVARTLRHWEPILEIRSNGLVLHQENATEPVRKAFGELVERGFYERSKRHDAERYTFLRSPAFEALFGEKFTE